MLLVSIYLEQDPVRKKKLIKTWLRFFHPDRWRPRPGNKNEELFHNFLEIATMFVLEKWM
jgi:hypothetical protein